MSDETRLSALESAVEALKGLVAQYDELQTVRMQDATVQAAEMKVVWSVLAELAEQVGVTPEDFESHRALRLRWFYERLILDAGDKDPSLADRLLLQFPGESEPPPDGFPSIFDPPTDRE